MTTKKLVIEFHDYTVSPKTHGLKYVLFRLDAPTHMIGYDFGFAYWGEYGWEEISQDGITTKVVKWAEQPNPQLLF